MRNLVDRLRAAPLPRKVATTMALLIVAGILIWILPFVTRDRSEVAGVPSPPPMDAETFFRVPPGGRACLNGVALEAHGDLAAFATAPSAGRRPFVQRIDVELRAPGFRARGSTPSGYTGGPALVRVRPPSDPVIGEVCWTNRGAHSIRLLGSTEPRTVTRSHVSVDGVSEAGDVSLTFYDARGRSMLGRLGDAFDHVSNLKDRILPSGLLLVLVALAVVGIPALAVTAFRAALDDDAPDA